jgi:hypothetical protein
MDRGAALVPRTLAVRSQHSPVIPEQSAARESGNHRPGEVPLNVNAAPRLLSSIKRHVVPSGRRMRHVPFGLYRRLRLNIDLGSQMQTYLGLWDRETHRDIRRLVQHVRWFIDVGAGGGELCLLFKKAGTRIVIAAEPQIAEVALLRENLAANGLRLSEVEIITKRIGTTEGCIRIDDFKVDSRHAGFIKIDVDGAELDVLRSSRHAVVFQALAVGFDQECYLDHFSFHTKVIRNAWWRLSSPNYVPLRTIVGSGPQSECSSRPKIASSRARQRVPRLDRCWARSRFAW